MSLFAADRVILTVGADRLIAVETRGWRSKRTAEITVPLVVSEGEPRFDALTLWLGTCRARRLQVRLSSAWVRFVFLPWQPALADDALSLDYTRSLLVEQYGTAAADWHLSLAAPAHQRARVAAAVDPRWIGGLQALAERHGMRLQSITPLLSMVYRKLARALPREALLAVVEPRRLSIVHIDHGSWTNLHQSLLAEPWTRRLPGLITQASATLDALSVPVFLAAPMYRRVDFEQVRAQWLQLPARRGFDPVEDRRWAFCVGC